MDIKKATTVSNKKAKEQRDVFVLVISLVISCAFMYLAVKPLYEEKKVLEGEVIKRQNDLQNKRQLLLNIEDFNRKNSSLIVDAGKLKIFVPKRNDYEGVMQHLNQIAVGQNLSVTGYEISAEEYGGDSSSDQTAAPTGEGEAATTEPQEKLKTQRVSINLEGGYDSLVSFMKVIENGVPFLQEASAEIVGPKRDETEESSEIDYNPTLTCAIDLDFVYY